jgi:mRNA-degrading endonuclease toxin of MazEF toxin-antitoxin module
VPQVGDIVRFNYLWARESEAGEECGRKARPVCVIVRTFADPAALFLLPLTSRRPSQTRTALTVPEIECKRGGLRAPCWIICDEYNRVTMDLAHDFESLDAVGTFSASFLKQIATSLKREAIARRAKMVIRR